MLDRISRIHFIGIGGVGMSGIAQIFLRMGYRISGSDLRNNRATRRLTSLGATIYEGHKASNVKMADLVVYSSAISQDNPELAFARKKKIKVLMRAEILVELMRRKVSFVVAGAHGKTTTTSMLAFLLKEAGYNPSVCVGGVVRNFDENCLLGDSRYFVAELDESDGSFLYYNPDYAILTNIDYEHVDYFKNWSNILKAYKKFVTNVKNNGLLVACADDKNIMHILENHAGERLLYGFSKDAEITAKNIKLDGLQTCFSCTYKNKALGEVILNVPGRHNILNALGVIGTGLFLGIEFDKIRHILSRYQGTERRFHVRFSENGFIVADDYAHHPTEIRATLEAARSLKPKRLLVAFQPHRFSRTKALMEEFMSCFDLADSLMITDIYPASEKPLAGVNAMNICARLCQNGQSEVVYLKKNDIIKHTLKILQEGDLMLFLGAGDIYKLSQELAGILKEKEVSWQRSPQVPNIQSVER